MLRLERSARTSRRDTFVHGRRAESLCGAPGYGRIGITGVKNRSSRRVPGPASSCRGRSDRDRTWFGHDRRLGPQRNTDGTRMPHGRGRRQTGRHAMGGAARTIGPTKAACGEWVATRRPLGWCRLALRRRVLRTGRRRAVRRRHRRWGPRGGSARLVAQGRRGLGGRKSAGRRICRRATDGRPSERGVASRAADRRPAKRRVNRRACNVRSAEGRRGCRRARPHRPATVATRRRVLRIHRLSPRLRPQPRIPVNHPDRAIPRVCSQSFGVTATKKLASNRIIPRPPR